MIIENSENITVEENDIDHTYHGIHIKSRGEVEIKKNMIVDIDARGIMIDGQMIKVVITENSLRNTGVLSITSGGKVVKSMEVGETDMTVHSTVIQLNVSDEDENSDEVKRMLGLMSPQPGPVKSIG